MPAEWKWYADRWHPVKKILTSLIKFPVFYQKKYWLDSESNISGEIMTPGSIQESVTLIFIIHELCDIVCVWCVLHFQKSCAEDEMKRKEIALYQETLFYTFGLRRLIYFLKKMVSAAAWDRYWMIPGPLFIKKTLSYQYRDSHYKPETVVLGLSWGNLYP